jgi:hypothetical protein
MAEYSNRLSALTDEDIVLENLPEYVLAAMEVRDRWFARTTGPAGEAEFFVVEDLLRWLPGQTVRVAFLGGTPELHRDIEQATRQITDACNLRLDFGFNPQTGTYRSWSTADTAYTADIRVSFDQDGYFSLVGTDSINPNLSAVIDPIGGRPNQRSLNLEGFDIFRPAGWQGTVRHEFLHALAFHHEHQSPNSGCEDEFRWQDDPGYQPTRDANGRYISDPQGRRPGIYTYLAGYPNFWSRRIVDHNLRRLRPAGLTFGVFDRASVMLYRFPPLFYRSSPSPCAPTGNGQELSDGDRAGLRHLYPQEGPEAEAIGTRRVRAFEALLSSADVDESLKETLGRQRHALTHS